MKLRVPARRTVARAGAATVALALACALGAWALVRSGTLVDRARFTHPDDARLVLDRAGRPLRHVRADGADRRWVPLASLSPHLVHAIIAAEDGGFYRHDGVDFRAVFRAAARNLLPFSQRSGASTITQQLIKRTYPRGPGLYGKAVEALRALSLERVMTKDEILEQYVNRLPFGDGIEGVARACEEYFGHDCSTLSPAEAALIAAIPRAPSATEPRRHRERALARREVVLIRMETQGFISPNEHALASREVLRLADTPARAYAAPRFVDLALRAADVGSERLVTSLDLDVQRGAQDALRATLARVEGRGARNGAAIVLANATGEVLGYATARQGEASAGGEMDLLRARRQPGSALKPFAYELWFERGGTAATVLDDVATAMTGAGGAAFEARDYDGVERGPVRARVALASSLNLAALDVARRAGPDALVARLRSLGFSLPESGSSYGAGVVLGDGAVTATELARAFSALARGGTLPPLTLRPSPPSAGTRVMHPGAAQIAWEILSDPSARRTAFGDDLRTLTGGRDFALKTGTSSGWRDAWAAAADARVTVVVWFGDPGGAAMAEVSGFDAAAPTAARILALSSDAAARDGIAAVEPPASEFTEVSVCPFSGLRAGPRCPHAIRERFVAGTAPAQHCEAHDEAGRNVVPPRLRAWVERTHPAGVVVAQGAQPPLGVGAANLALVVRAPRDRARWMVRDGAGVEVPLRADAGGLEVDAEWTVDGARVGAPRFRASPGTHTIVASYGGVRSAPVRVTVATAGGG